MPEDVHSPGYKPRFLRVNYFSQNTQHRIRKIDRKFQRLIKDQVVLIRKIKLAMIFVDPNRSPVYDHILEHQKVDVSFLSYGRYDDGDLEPYTERREPGEFGFTKTN